MRLIMGTEKLWLNPPRSTTSFCCAVLYWSSNASRGARRGTCCDAEVLRSSVSPFPFLRSYGQLCALSAVSFKSFCRLMARAMSIAVLYYGSVLWQNIIRMYKTNLSHITMYLLCLHTAHLHYATRIEEYPLQVAFYCYIHLRR